MATKKKVAAKPASEPEAVVVATGIGCYRVLNAKKGHGDAGAEIRMSNGRAAALVAAGELERI